MIEGLKFQVTGEKLREHCRERSEHHVMRAKWFADQMVTQKAHADCAEEPDQSMTSLIEGKQAGLRAKRDQHQRLARKFRFYADHVPAGSGPYSLSQSELYEIEMIE